MNVNLYEIIRDRLLFESEKGAKKGSNSFLLMKHYNTLAFGEADKKKVEQREPHTFVHLHEYKLTKLVGVFEPFLDYARKMLKQCSDEEIDKILDQCAVYSLHKSVLKSFLRTGVCVREEALLIDEVAFEQEKIATAVVNLLQYIAGENKIVFLLNELQYASGSAFHVIHNMMEDETCKNILVVATYNEAKMPLPHIVPLWNRFYRFLTDRESILETSHGSSYQNESLANTFQLNTRDIEGDIIKVKNLLLGLDFSHSHYYLEIMYKMITVEAMEVEQQYHRRILELYILVSIYTQDFSQALLLCEKMREMEVPGADVNLDFRYQYFMGLAHMYNGKLDEALAYAENCLAIAERYMDEFRVFESKILYVMVQMAGWHNIFFCANDLKIDEEIIHLAKKYHYWNHLAHIYVYAYDNDPALFADETKLEERLVHFNQGIDIMKRLGNAYFMMEAYQNNIMIASTNGFFKTASYYYGKCHEMVCGKSEHEEAMIYNGVGYISSAMEDYDKASDCYHKALTIFLSLEEIDYVGETLYNMAINCIMAQDYKSAYQYLEIAFRIVKDMKINSLRVCNISKLAGLMAICSYYMGNDLMCAVYTEKTQLFLEHIIGRCEETDHQKMIHDYTTCKDDLFIYYYIVGVQSMRKGDYHEALKNFEMAAGCIDISVGNQFYIFHQYITELAKLYRLMGREEDAVQRLKGAIAFYQQQGCKQKVKELQAQLTEESACREQYHLGLPAFLIREVDDVLRHAAVFKENQEQQKRMVFVSAWQKMVEITDKKKEDLVETAVNAFIHNFNIDKMLLIKYYEGQPEEIFNNMGYAFVGERREKIENFFYRNRLGVVTSKINNNYIDYLDIVMHFDKNKICSIIGIPFYYNDSLKAIMIAYIEMKENWHTLSNRYLLDDGDYAIFEFLMRQLLTAVDMLEANEKIRQMNDKLNYLAVTDKLTGLYNREGFYLNIEMLIHKGSADQMQPITVMYIDLDNFKHYNDTYGHGVGDIILMEMADIFRREVGKEGFVTRYGGDEFLATFFTDERRRIEEAAQRIYAAIEAADGFEPIIKEKLKKAVKIPKAERISCSIGISYVNSLHSDEELEQMIKEADKALYEVKRSGKGVHKFYALKH